MSNTSQSPGPRGSTAPSPNLTGTGRSSPVRSTSTISRSARGSIKKPNPNLKRSSAAPPVLEDAQEFDARAEQLLIMDEYKDKASKAEAKSEEYLRQLQGLQSRLNESLQEHGKFEEQLHDREVKLVDLEDQIKQATKQRRELENSIEAERNSMLRDQADQKAKEQELQAANQRLKDSLAERDLRPRKMSESEAEMIDQSSSQPAAQLSGSQESLKKGLQKDKIIEELRSDLVGCQVKMVELENVGSNRLQELKKTVLETQAANARLMEENESFQLLLSEKTLNGDFTKTEVMQPSTSLNSLEEELESVEGESDNYRRLEVEAKGLKDQNKALNLYIETIIWRLLSHKEFENVLEKSPDLMSSIARPGTASTVNKEKELPPPPPAKDDEPAPSLLQRAKSVVNGPRRPRPLSFMGISAASSQSVQDTSEPTSAPMTRSSSGRQDSHRRSQSEMPLAAPASIVSQMSRGIPSSGSGGPLSPGISPGTAIARNPFFASATGTGATSSNPSSRQPSASRFSQEPPESSSNSTYSDKSGDVVNKDRSKSGYTNFTGAVMAQNRLRPLRLVQENREMENEGNEGGKFDDIVARKKANRSSWMPGWFNQAKKEDTKGVGSENGNFF
ncbi:MAG: hypothetical protein Q9218_002712 [Villophora microphyllina]